MIQLIFLLGCTALLQAAQPPQELFPVYGPVEDADPSVRRDTVLFVPNRVMIDSLKTEVETLVFVAVDTSIVSPVELTIGQRMILGLRHTFFVVSQGEWHQLQHGHGGSARFDHVRHFLYPHRWDIEESSDLEIVAVLSVFETDIPMQHLWTPEAGQFSVLWSDTLRVDWSPAGD